MKHHMFVVTFSLILFSLPCSVTDASSLSEDEQKVEILLDAVRQALRPVTNMKVQYLLESSSSIGTFKKPVAIEQLSTHKQEISIILGGNRSRMERIYKIAKNNNEMHVLNTKVSVFDGKRFRLLEERPDPTGCFIYRGNLALEDNNHGLLIRHLSGLPINIFEPKIIAGFTFELQPSSTAGIYILDAIRIKNKARRRLTIDGNRGFNVIKVESILPNGKIDYETNCRLKEYESGIWYPCEYEKIRHTKSKPDGSPFIETKMKIRDIKFNIDVNDDMFKLEFPYGTQVFDSVWQGIYTIGDPKNKLPDSLFSSEGQDIGEENYDDQHSANTKPTVSEAVAQLQTEDTVAQSTGLNESENGRKLFWVLPVILVLVAIVIVISLRRHKSKVF